MLEKIKTSGTIRNGFFNFVILNFQKIFLEKSGGGAPPATTAMRRQYLYNKGNDLKLSYYL